MHDSFSLLRLLGFFDIINITIIQDVMKMYLKKIVASGFKSFADKTVIDLSKGITGIVGPNGSGKSNVVDAVRWVLGEQSVKSLRGDGTMSDVIFSGSKSRNGMNVASVTLIFDNTDKYLNLDYTEVSVRRRVYKDGTNEYSINDEKCRLKDLTDLFLDSGIAKESFNIISQGKVEEIISSKPENRRVVFEEAAGVLKYRKRKEEALRKLEKTHDNLDRVNDIRKELESQVEPLRVQREKALMYKEKSSTLEHVEVALMASDIQRINFNYQTSKQKIETLNEEILSLSTATSSGEAKIETLKKELISFDQEISDLTKSLMEAATDVEKASSKKAILLERQKYEVDDIQVHQNIVSLKEEEMKLKVDLSSLMEEIRLTKEALDVLMEEAQGEEKKLEKVQKEKEELGISLNLESRNNFNIKTKVSSLKESIEHNALLPSAVKAVLNHPKLTGIHDIIGHILEIDEEYVTAITTSLGASSNFIIVDHEKSASEAIEYLKENHLGRATFFPLNIIKGKSVDETTLSTVKKLDGFIGVASNLVKFDPKYLPIVENQLGNVLVVDSLDHANKISKAIHHRYKMVTLDGELLHVGGSLTGGSVAKVKNVISEKYELEETLKKLDYSDAQIAEIENKINDCDYRLKSIEDKVYLTSRKKIERSEILTQKDNLKKEKEARLTDLQVEIKGNDSILNQSLSKEEEKAMKEYYDALERKQKLEQLLESLKTKRKEKNSHLEEIEFESRKENSLVFSKNKELKALEIEVNRMDVKLDTLLSSLNDTYSMTYEHAIQHYPLEMDIEEARNLVSRLKIEIKDLGTINMLAIEEYEKVNERYRFLKDQEEDLLKAEDTLLEIIKEMDAVMEKEFKETFNVIREHFKSTFKDLFHGGDADLKLTDPSNLLETGIEIVASPPGKTLKTISFLSGGEKTFTAISLLFAILKSRPVPYCILDEVEAALDEVNVDSFGEYLRTLKEKTQFILITHKKKTMEYADYLYGITMQESGVSKLVSVKLEEVKE